MVQAFKYFEEMERLTLLSPTNFSVLKVALESIGRPDLVKKIKGKEEYFATLFRQKITDYNSLDSKDCDVVCDGIKEAAVHYAELFPCGPRSGQDTIELQEKLKVISNEKGGELQLQELVDELQVQSAPDEPMTLVEVEPNAEMLPSRAPVHPAGTKAKTTPFLQTDEAKQKKLDPDEVETDGTNAEGKLLEEIPCKLIPTCGDHMEVGDDVVTDSNEKDIVAAETNKIEKEESTSKEDSMFHESEGQVFGVDHAPSSSSYEAGPTANAPLQLKSYKKKGYSVTISNGHLCECTSEKGVVIMENGSTFSIAITNSNDYAAEVDVTFGGRYLGFWSMDALQTNPLIIEGSAWEKGKLTFTSDTLEIPSAKAQHSGFEPSGKIELEFKPEAIALFIQHVRSDKKHEILLTDFKTATVDDLKEEINRTLWESLGIISCFIKDGGVLHEQNTIRSYSLKNGDIIQVLTNEEPVSVELQGMEPFTIRVDPYHDSTETLMKTIAEKTRIPTNKQQLWVSGEDLTETDRLVKIFLKSKKPVIKVAMDQAQESHRGVKLSPLKKPGTTRGFGGCSDFESHAPVSHFRGFSSGSRTFRGDPEEHECSDDGEDISIQLPPDLREGKCFLQGDDSFVNQFQLDTVERKYSKDKLKAVTLIIQLCARSSGGDTTLPGPVSTPCPPAVPE